MTSPAAVVDGVDVDAVARAVAGCPAVDGLCSPRERPIATYLPGRLVEGVRVDPDRLVVAVRARWGVPARTLAAQVRRAVGPVAGSRTLELVLGDVADPVAADAARIGAGGVGGGSLGG